MIIHRLYNEFRRCLKPIYIEEIFDLFIYRPIAYLLVKAAQPFPITPNQISVLGIGAALVGALMFAQGTPVGFLLGGLATLAVSVLDCADGMLARLKGTGTTMGRVIDGLFDYTTSTLLLVGFWWGARSGTYELPFTPWIMFLAAGLLIAVQSMVVDYYKAQFLAHALGQGRSIEHEIGMLESELQRLTALGGHYVDRVLIALYIFYSHVQAKTQRRSNRLYDRDDYFKRMVVLTRLWTLIGPSTYRAAIILAGLANQPIIFLHYALVAANIWLVAMLIAQTLVKRDLRTLKPDLARAARGSEAR